MRNAFKILVGKPEGKRPLRPRRRCEENIRMKPPIQLVPGALFLGLKRPECEADYSPPSIVEVKNTWSYTSAPPVRLH
jgi:hypothetical protein